MKKNCKNCGSTRVVEADETDQASGVEGYPEEVIRAVDYCLDCYHEEEILPVPWCPIWDTLDLRMTRTDQETG